MPRRKSRRRRRMKNSKSREASASSATDGSFPPLRVPRGSLNLGASPCPSPSSSTAGTPRFHFSPPGTPQMSPLNSPRGSISSQSSNTPVKRLHRSMWVQEGLSFRDILMGKRLNFENEKKKVEASVSKENISASEDVPLANGIVGFVGARREDPLRAYNTRLLQQLNHHKKGYEKIKAYNEKLNRRKDRQEVYNNSLETTRKQMENKLQDPSDFIGKIVPNSEPTEKIENAAPLNIEVDHPSEGDEIDLEAQKFEKATKYAQSAVDLQRAASQKAKENAEAKAAEVTRLEQRLAGLQRALEREEQLRKMESNNANKRTEESKMLQQQVEDLRSKLGDEEKKRLEESKKAAEAARALEGVEENLGKEKERNQEAEKKRKEQETTARDLETKIIQMRNKIKAELEEKDRIKAEMTKNSSTSQKLRENIAQIEAKLAEQTLARAKAETKAKEIAQNYESKFKEMQAALAEEKKIKSDAEAEALKSQNLSKELRDNVQKLEDKLRVKEEAALAELEDTRRKQRRVQAEAEAAKAAAAAVLEATRLKEKAAKGRELELKKELEKNLEETQRKNEENTQTMQMQQAALEEATKKMQMQQAALEEALRKVQESQAQFQASEKLRRAEEDRRRALHNRVQDLLGHVRVYCRIRPMGKDSGDSEVDFRSRLEDGLGVLDVTQAAASTVSSRTRRRKRHTFTFDRIFGTDSVQSDIFEHVRPLITSSMDGFDVTLFAYGQTGSGKTFTMFGPPECNLKTGELRGVIPRAIDHIFSTIEESKQKNWIYVLSASIMEIYNENIYDLLASGSSAKKRLSVNGNGGGGGRRSLKSPRSIKSPRSSPRASNSKDSFGGLEIKKNKEGKVEVVGLTKVPVESPARLHELTRSAAERATWASTQMNARSSRSHTIFQLYIEGKQDEGKKTVQSKLTLVDLAGSERLSKTNADGERLAEAKSINTSLSLLGNTVRALAEKSKHVPYRDSKLTYLLHQALSGTGKTAVVVNIASQESNLGESLCTLRFADKLKLVTSK
mmetsp:Transcript_26568/g.36763  ORF Transcript_26568/g.36763 Transcript_26568/m.36763 type:complete len:1020 (+) Transcript_26568:99-3158(+)